MNTMPYTDIISDQSFNDGFEKGKKVSQRKLVALKKAAQAFIDMYERTFGEPTDCEEFFNLKKALK